MSFAGTAARGSAIATPVEGMAAYLEDSNILSIYDGTNWKNSLGAVGGILQVVSTTKTDTFSLASATFADVTGLSATITPKSASSNILVIVNLVMGMSVADWRQFRILRGSTAIGIGDAAGNRTRATSSQYFGTSDPTGHIATESGTFLDSPNTTTETIYKIQVRAASGTVFVNRSSNDGDTVGNARTISSITLMEVSA
jgi:hypothetical protein